MMATIESAKTSGVKACEAEREHRQREADEAVAAHLQEHAGEDDRARRRRLDMSIGQPGMHGPHRHLHRERGEEGEPQPGLQRAREVVGKRLAYIARPGLEIDGDERQQHQYRAQERVEEELEGGIDPPRAAPDADDEEHRNEHALEEDIEEEEVEGAERAHHQGLEHQERDHVFAHAQLDRVPAREDADGRKEARQQNEEQRDPVDPHTVVDVEAGEPRRFLDELEIAARWVEIRPHGDRQREIEQ